MAIEGVPTDVEEERPRKASAGDRDERQYDPLVGGIASSNAEGHIFWFNLGGYYGPVRRRAPRPVLNAFGCCLGTLPLATIQGPCGPRSTFRRSPSHVPCKSRRPGSRRLYAGRRLARTREPARLITRAKLTPGFDATYSYRRFHSARPAKPPAGRFWNVFLVPT